MVSVYEAAGVAGDGPRCAVCTVLLVRTEVEGGRVVCVRCEDRALRALTTVQALWEQLPNWVEKGTVPAGSGGRGGGGTGSAAPGNLAALSLLAGDVTARLVVWEDDWRRTQGWEPATLRGGQDEQLAGVLRFLRDLMPWAVRNDGPAVHGLLGDAERLVGEMRSIVDPGPRSRVRTELLCPVPLAATTSTGGDGDDGPVDPDGSGEGGVEVLVCGGQLIVDLTRHEIHCHACHTVVPRRRWLELGITLGTIPMPNAA